MNSIKDLSLLRIWGVSTIMLLLVVSGCSISETSSRKVKSKIQDTETTNNPLALDAPPTKLTLTLDNPNALSIKQGDVIVKDQILVNRSAARQRILTRRQKIQAELLMSSATVDVPIPLPDTDALVTQVKQAQEQVRLQEAQLQKHYADSPYTEAARQTLSLPAEEARIKQLKVGIAQAQAQVKESTAQLKSIKAVQQSRQKVKTTSSNKTTQLTKELETLNTQLQSLQDILSPHDGIVQGIEWLKQGKEGHIVELALSVNASTDPTTPLLSSPNDPLLPISPNAPGVTTGTQPFPNAPLENPQQPSLPLNLQTPAPAPTVSGN